MIEMRNAECGMRNEEPTDSGCARVPFRIPQSSIRISRSGFSFAEVMFAVVVLGIGFIMVAAIFPVAIKQTQLNTEETIAVAVARNGVNVMTELGASVNPNRTTDPNAPTVPLLVRTDVLDLSGGATSALALPPTGDFSFRFGTVASLRDRRLYNGVGSALHAARQRDAMWRAVAGNLIQPTDPRYAWVPLYIREMEYKQVGPVVHDKPMPFARVIIFGCTVRNRPAYNSGDVTPFPPPAPGGVERPEHFTVLEPKPVAVQVVLANPLNSDEGYVIKFFSIRALPGNAGFESLGTNDAVYDRFARDAIGEGSFVVIADDRIVERGTSNRISANSGRMNGLVLRVGVRRPELDESGTYPKFAWSLMPGFEFAPHPGADGQFAGPAEDDINRLGYNDTGTYGDVTINGVRTLGDNVAFAGGSGQQGCVAYIIGRGFSNPQFTPGSSSAGSEYEGATQDVAVYTAYVPVK